MANLLRVILGWWTEWWCSASRVPKSSCRFGREENEKVTSRVQSRTGGMGAVETAGRWDKVTGWDHTTILRSIEAWRWRDPGAATAQSVAQSVSPGSPAQSFSNPAQDSSHAMHHAIVDQPRRRAAPTASRPQPCWRKPQLRLTERLPWACPRAVLPA
ncbi:hypothetical protein EDB80DRAFT_371461 [Ilyonectria destructans]|nr:hypothetical protein EDB80DRAFT_371461 [Ilyonectria destructans]